MDCDTSSENAPPLCTTCVFLFSSRRAKESALRRLINLAYANERLLIRFLPANRTGDRGRRGGAKGGRGRLTLIGNVSGGRLC